MVALALVAGLLTYVGCSSPKTETDKASPAAAAVPPAPTGGTKLVRQLADPGRCAGHLGRAVRLPRAVRLHRGPARRPAPPLRLRRAAPHKQNWPLALIDLGSLIKDPAGARGGFEQAKFKFDVALKALALLNYGALALGAEDLKVGVDEALIQFLNSLGEQTKVVGANVRPAEGFEAMVRPSLMTAAGPVESGSPPCSTPRPSSAWTTRTRTAAARGQAARRGPAGRPGRAREGDATTRC